MLTPPAARRLLLGASLWLCGCVTVPDPPQVAQPAPAPQSWLDRVLRRSKNTVPESTPAIAEDTGDPKDPARLSLAYAQLMEQAGDLSQAEQHYQRALDAKPANLDALVGLGRVHLSAGRYGQAEQLFNRAIKQDANFAPALHGLGQVAAARNQWESASELLNSAILAEPENGAIRYDLAVALVHTGQIDAAVSHFIRTVGDAEAHYNVGLILQRAGRLQESEQQLRMALAKDPHLEPAQYWLEEVQREQQLPSAPPPLVTAHAGPLSGDIQPVAYEAAAR